MEIAVSLSMFRQFFHLYQFKVFPGRRSQHRSIIRKAGAMTGTIPAFFRCIPFNGAFDVRTV
jgi:hypothetical protein